MCAASGDMQKVKDAIAAGVDIDSLDHARCTAIQVKVTIYNFKKHFFEKLFYL